MARRRSSLGSEWEFGAARRRSKELASGEARAVPAFVEALRRCDFAAVVDSVAAGADFNAKDSRGVTPLMIVAMSDADASVGLVRFLLEAQAHLEARDGSGLTALVHACRSNNSPVVKELLKSGASATTASRDGVTAAMHAVLHGSDALARRLLAHVESVEDADENGWTILFHSCHLNRTVLAAWLLQKRGADARWKAHGDVTALMLAAQHDSLELVQLLVEHKAKPGAINADGDSVLMVALRHSQRDVALWLMDQGVSLSVRNKAGQAASDVAQANGLKSMVDYIDAAMFLVSAQGDHARVSAGWGRAPSKESAGSTGHRGRKPSTRAHTK